MIKITIDIKFEAKGLVQDYVDAAYKAMEELMMAAYQEWQDEAGRKLHTTRRAYRDAIQHKLVSPGEVELSLQQSDDKDNWIAGALEAGHPGFSIRDRVLAKAKKHTEREMSDRQRRAMFSYLARVGRLGKPPVPYTDIPFRTGGGKEQGKPNKFRRISPNTAPGTWKHPGFKPIGGGGLEKPLRDAVIAFVEKEAPVIFNKLLSKVAV